MTKELLDYLTCLLKYYSKLLKANYSCMTTQWIHSWLLSSLVFIKHGGTQESDWLKLCLIIDFKSSGVHGHKPFMMCFKSDWNVYYSYQFLLILLLNPNKRNETSQEYLLFSHIDCHICSDMDLPYLSKNN